MKRVPLDKYCEKKIETLQKNYIGLIDYIDISAVDNEEKRIIESRIKLLQQKMEEFENKVGLKGGNFMNATSSDLCKLEDVYDAIQLYREELNRIEKNIDKLSRKLSRNVKRR